MFERKLAFLAKSLLFVILTFAFHVGAPAASVVDTPHNETNNITCGKCHSYSLWWRYSPVFATSDYPTIADAVCNQCHGSAGPAFVKAGHSTASMGAPHPVAGTWSTKCVDCHDPHLQQQVNWLPSSPVFNDGTLAGGVFLVEGEMRTIQDIGDGTTTFNFDNGLAKQGWEDAADWTMKSGHDGRGLILALGYGKVDLTYEVVAASVTAMPSELPATGAGTITVQNGNAPLPNNYKNTPFGLFYGQLVKDIIKTPHSGPRSVKFLDGKDGLITTSATPRDGVCQVCHTVTKYWRNNGDTNLSTELHNPTITCTLCHYSETGFKVSGGPHTFLEETPFCMTCHPSGDILAVHKNNCQHCHTTTPPTLADPATKPLVLAILRGTCQGCHGVNGVKAHTSETAHNHRQTTPSCADCHAVANATAIDALHKNDCATCHGYAGAKLNQATVATAIATGMSGTDVNCQTCHTAVGHATETDHNHRKTVASCADCHTIATQAAIDTLHQQGCDTCHGYTGAKINQTTVANAIATGKGATGTDVNCQTCHTVGHESATDHNHRNTVDTCAVCHPVVPAEIDEIHNDELHNIDGCLICHGYTGVKLDPSTVADAIADGKGPNGADVNCQTCHTFEHVPIVLAGNAMNHLVSQKPEEPWYQPCITCHDATINTLPPAHNNLQTVTPCSGCHGGSSGDFDAIWSVHKNDCFKCHFSARPEVLTAINAGRINPGAPVYCTTCHGATKHDDSTAVHNHRQKVDSCASASCHVADTAMAVDTLHKSNCTTCHGYTGAKLDPTTVANAISAGMGTIGANVDCQTCHNTYNGHHDTVEAANNDCAITCHTTVNHSSTVAADTACASCHTGTAGTITGVPLSLSDAAIHDSCRTCHTFDANKRGVLVNFSNQKGVNGDADTMLPDGGSIGGTDGGGICTNCHTVPVSDISSYHHTSTRTAVGQCETCHADPRPSWGPDIPGDNGTAAGSTQYGATASGLTQYRPTQMACLKCHVTFAGGSMQVTKFERTDYTSYRTDWTRTTAHTIPMTGTRINNYGTCLSCHYQGNTKRYQGNIKVAPPVTLWHAHPSQSGNTAWTFGNNAGKTFMRGSGSYAAPIDWYQRLGDYAHYLPGRSKWRATDIAPQSGISGFNIFHSDYGDPPQDYLAVGFGGDYRSSFTDVSYGKAMDVIAFTSPAYDTPAFTRIAVPETAQLGVPASTTLNATTRSVPVFASLAPLTSQPPATDSVKVKNAIYDSSTFKLTVVASTSNASGCSTLNTWYGGVSYPMTATASNCTATIDHPTYPASGSTVDVKTTNSLGLNVLGYRIATPNPGTINFSAPTYSVAENGGTATITVSRTGGSTSSKDGKVTVNYTTANGTATAGTGNDYTTNSGTLTFNDGETDKTFTVAINNDTTPESNESVNLTLTNPLSPPSGGIAILGRQSTAQLTIVDNDFLAGTIAFDPSTYTVSEDGGAATITVKRTGGSTGAVSVDYTTSSFGSTAKAGSNYTPKAGTLTWGNGETGSRTFTIDILKDTVTVQNTALNLYLSNPTGSAQLGTQNRAVVNITTPAVAVLNDWSATPQLTGTSGNLSGSFTIGNGPNRLLLVAVSCKANAGITGQTFSATYGGKPLIQADIQNLSNYQTWIGYLNEADIAGRTGNGVNVTVDGVHTGVVASIASYQNVNQTIPIAASGGNSLATVFIYHGEGWWASAVNASPLLAGPGAYAIYNWSNGFNWNSDNESYAKKTSFNSSGILGGVASKPVPAAATTNPTVTWTSPSSSEGASSGITLNSYAGTTAVALASSSYSVKENGGALTITVSRLGSALGAVSVHADRTFGDTGWAQPNVDYTPFGVDLNWGINDMADKTFDIPIIHDQATYYNKSLNLALTSPQGAILGSPNTAMLTIINVDSQINFTDSTYSVGENGGEVTITASRQSSSTEEVSVHYATTGGTATPVTDYTPVDGTLTWGIGDTANKTFKIFINNNQEFSGDKTVGLALTNPTGVGATLRDPNTAVLTIAEDESAIGFSAATYSIKENSGQATITVVRQGTSTGALSVDCANTGATAVVGTACGTANGQLTWAEGDLAAKTFTIPILDDTTPEENESVTLTLSNLTGGAFLLPTNPVVLTIVDNDHPGTIALTSSTYSVNEDSATGWATITARRTGGADGAVTVRYVSSSSTAVDWELDYYNTYWDYHLCTNTGTISWADGDMADKTLDVNINRDTRWEGNETMDLVLTPLTGLATLGSPNTAVLTIVDDEDRPGAIALTASNYSVDEDAGTATITATRTGGYNGAVSIHYATTTGGTATAGTDYTPKSGNLSWANGDTVAKTFTISILNNSAQAGDKTVNLALTSPAGGATLAAGQDTAVLTISDDEAKAGTIALTTATYSVDENVGTVTITATRTRGSIGQVGVHYATDPGDSTATAGSDYAANSGDLSWGNGETGSRTFTITILPDSEVEGNESVAFSLSSPTGGATLGSPSQGVLTIEAPGIEVLDAWPAAPQILGSAPTMSTEFDIGSEPNRLLLVAVSCKTIYGGTYGQTFSVTYGGKPLTQAAVQNSYATTWIGYLTETDIDSRTGNTVQVSVNGGYEVLGASIASYYNVNQTNPIAESGGYRTSNSTWFEYYNLAVNPSPLSVNPGGYAIYNWTDISSANRTGDTESYTEDAEFYVNGLRGGIASKAFASAANTKPVITWANDEPFATDSVITINKFGDNNFAVPATASLALGAPTYRFNENGGAATITVSRNGSNHGAVSVHYDTTGSGTATAYVDYTPISGDLNWADGDMSDKPFTINLINNQSYDPDKTISLALSAPTGEDATLGVPSTSLLTIVNDEAAPQTTIAFAASAYSIDENAGTATITVSRTGPLSGAASVSYTASGNSATKGTDYSITPGVLNWGAGDMADKTFTVNIIDNGKYFTNNKTVYLSLSNAVGSAVLGTPNMILLTIVEGDIPPIITFSSSTFSVNENDPTEYAIITLKRSGNSNGLASVYVQTRNEGGGTAISGTDYRGVYGNMKIWEDGDTTDKTLSIRIYDNLVYDVDKTVILDLFIASNSTLGSPATATLTIVNDEPAPPNTVVLSASSYSVNENGGTATITVSRTGDPTGTAGVSYSTTGNGTATEGLDYSPVSGTLTWVDGDMADKTFEISITDNSAYAVDKTVSLALNSPTGGTTILGSPNEALLTIVNDDAAIAFTSSAFSVNENGGTATITVSRLGNSTGAVGVSYATTTGGTAAAAVDYTATSGTLSWANGDMADKSFSIPIIDNSDPTTNKTVNLALTAPTGGVTLQGVTNTSVLTIIEDDAATFAFSASAYSVNENAGTATITVQRLGSSANLVFLYYENRYDYTPNGPGEATGGSDFGWVFGRLRWEAGDTTDKTFTVTVFDDAVQEGNETVDLRLFFDSSYEVYLVDVDAAVLTIIDND